MRKEKKDKFPNQIYVRWEYDRDGETRWLVSFEDARDDADLNDDKRMALYELKGFVAVKNSTAVVASK